AGGARAAGRWVSSAGARRARCVGHAWRWLRGRCSSRRRRRCSLRPAVDHARRGRLHPIVRMGRLLVALVVAAVRLVPVEAATPCRCRRTTVPRCADAAAKHRVTVRLDFAVENGTVEVVPQSGPYGVPVDYLDGKAVLFLFMPKGEVFNGFVQDAIPDSITLGTMQGAQATITTAAAFVPGEYELLLFIDAAPGGGLGPTRGDLAAFDNSVCEPTGVSVRVAVGCEDTSVTLTNKQFIIF